MEDRIHLQVLTTTHTVYDGDATYVHLPLEGGTVGILRNHAPLLGVVAEGVVTYRNDDKEHYIAVAHGVAHVSDNTVVVLVDAAERAENIDLARAVAAERRARTWLKSHAPEVDTVRAEAALHRALARQAAVRLMKK